jgi:hypothetical protein
MPRSLCCSVLQMRQQGLEPTGWYASLQDLLLPRPVFWGEMIDSNTIDVAMGRGKVDMMCMARWREFYHNTVWSGLAAETRG